MYDLLIRNNASKEITIKRGIENTSGTNLYLAFEVDLTDLPNGEYTYVAIYNKRDDVTYETNPVLLNTIVKCNEGELKLGDLKPITGVMRIGEVESPNTYNKRNDNKTIYYYKKKK
jgi:hypothetical protein